MLLSLHKVFGNLDPKVRPTVVATCRWTPPRWREDSRLLSRFLSRERECLCPSIAGVRGRMCAGDREGGERNIEIERGEMNEQRGTWGKGGKDTEEGAQKQPWRNLTENIIPKLVFRAVHPGKGLWQGWRCWRRRTEGSTSSALQPSSGWVLSQGSRVSGLSHKKSDPAGVKPLNHPCHVTQRKGMKIAGRTCVTGVQLPCSRLPSCRQPQPWVFGRAGSGEQSPPQHPLPWRAGMAAGGLGLAHPNPTWHTWVTGGSQG